MATPMVQLVWMDFSSTRMGGWRTATMVAAVRRISETKAMSGRTMMNSSPPRRSTESVPRTALRSRVAVWMRT